MPFAIDCINLLPIEIFVALGGSETICIAILIAIQIDR